MYSNRMWGLLNLVSLCDFQEEAEGTPDTEDDPTPRKKRRQGRNEASVPTDLGICVTPSQFPPMPALSSTQGSHMLCFVCGEPIEIYVWLSQARACKWGVPPLKDTDGCRSDLDPYPPVLEPVSWIRARGRGCGVWPIHPYQGPIGEGVGYWS